MRAHDVRHLRVCKSCGSIGDGRRMLTIGLHRKLAPGQHHAECVLRVLDDQEVLALALAQREKITLGCALDIRGRQAGAQLMRQLMDARE